MKKINKKSIINSLNTLCLFLLMFDSGGGLGLRNVAFFFIILYFIASVYNGKVKFKKNFIILYTLFIGSLIIPVYISIFNNISISEIFNWIIAFLLLPIFYIYVRESKLEESSFVYAGGIFATVIIVLFFGRLFGVGIIVDFYNYISPKMNGFLNMKYYSNGSILPNVYFQGTLSLVICAILSLSIKKNYIFTLILIAIVLAPSRFGFLVLSIFWLIKKIRESSKFLIMLPIIFLGIIAVLSFLPFGQELFSIFSHKNSGLNVRGGHLTSVIETLIINPYAFLFGAGPGSEFFTTGLDRMVNNIEISQLEYFRKYGVISFILFHIFYFSPFFYYRKINNSFFICGVLISYYILSFSNPVLLSLFAMLFLMFAYNKALPYKANKEAFKELK